MNNTIVAGKETNSWEVRPIKEALADDGPAKMSQAQLNDATAAAVVARVGYFAKETVKVLGDVGVTIGSFDGYFESMFHNVFNTMVIKYSQEVDG